MSSTRIQAVVDTHLRVAVTEVRVDDSGGRVHDGSGRRSSTPRSPTSSAISRIRPSPSCSRRRATERLLFPSLKVARREAQHDLFDEETHPPDLHTVETTTRAAEVIRIIEATGGAELREAMLATRGTDETLRAYVARTHPSATPAELARAYERLWRARSAVEERLRENARPAHGADPEAGAA